MNETTSLLLDCLFHVGCDPSKIENKKRVTVANQLMNEKKIQKLIDNSTGDNIPEPEIKHIDDDIDGDIAMTANV